MTNAADRWFTQPSGNAMAVLPNDFTTFEKRILAEIMAYAHDDDAHPEWELLHALDQAGTVSYGSVTGRKGVELSDEIVAARQAGPVRLWHNHPSKSSISCADWRIAGATDQTEIVAVTVNDTFFVGRMMDWFDQHDAVFASFGCLAGMLTFELQNYSTMNRCLYERIDFEHLDGHLVNLALCQLGMVRYAARLSQKDQKIFDAAANVGLVKVGIDYCVKEFRSMINAA